MPPIPCQACGTDLRGCDAVLVGGKPHGVDQDGVPVTVYKPVCLACSKLPDPEHGDVES